MCFFSFLQLKNYWYVLYDLQPSLTLQPKAIFFFFFAFFSFGVTNNKQTKDSDKWQKLRVQDQLVTYILSVLKTVIHALMSSNRHEAKRNETKQTKKERKDRKKTQEDRMILFLFTHPYDSSNVKRL